MLKTRPFVEGNDEPHYLNIVNLSMAEFSDFTPLTLAYAELENNEPNTDKRGRFIAEWNGKPVGYICALIDLLKPDKIGYMDGPFVVPEYRRKHIGSELIQTALKSFKDRGIKKTQAGARATNVPGTKIMEKFGFTVCRVFSQMKRSLDNLPQNVGEHTGIKIVDIGTSDEALKLENDLMNESFKEHFNFRPLTLEERIYYTREQEKQGEKFNQFVAYLNQKPIGIIITVIDPCEIEHKKEQVAWLAVLGVLKPFRHQGIGKALMLHAMQYLKNQGMEKVMLGVDDTNITQAMQIYQSLGFEVHLKRNMYIKEL